MILHTLVHSCEQPTSKTLELSKGCLGLSNNKEAQAKNASLQFWTAWLVKKTSSRLAVAPATRLREASANGPQQFVKAPEMKCGSARSSSPTEA